MKPTGVALTAVTGNGGLAVLWNLACPQLGMLQPAEQAVLHTCLAAITTALLAVLVRLAQRLSLWAHRELDLEPAPTGARAFRLELLAGLHERDRT
jgi:hypothetical protein